MSKNQRLLLTVIGLSIVLFIGLNIMGSDEGFLFDVKIMDLIHGKVTVVGQKIMGIITYLGSKYIFAVLGIGLFGYYVWAMEREKAWMVFIAIVVSYLCNAILKLTFARVRPEAYMLITKTSYSFPSGHAMVSMSFYSTMTYILTKHMKNRKLRPIIWILNFGLIGVIGFSRMYLGVHWPTDILAGYILGFMIFYWGKEKFGVKI